MSQELLESIVHRLHNTCRFNGAVAPRECDHIYSVLEHTTIGMHLLALRGASKEVRMGWACHDFHEAFIGDMITPLKNDPLIEPAWSKIERDEVFRVCTALNINPRLAFQPEVKAMDNEMVCAELYEVALISDPDKPFIFEKHGHAADMIATGYMWGMDKFWNEWKWIND